MSLTYQTRLILYKYTSVIIKSMDKLTYEDWAQHDCTLSAEDSCAFCEVYYAQQQDNDWSTIEKYLVEDTEMLLGVKF